MQILTAHDRCDGYSTYSDDVETFGKKVLCVSKSSMVQDRMALKVSLLNGTFLDNSASLEMEDRAAMLNDLLDKDLSLENKESPERDKNTALIIDKLGKDISLEKEKAKEKQKAGEKKRRYIVLGSWSKKNFSIFEQGSSTKIAQVVI